MHTKINRGFTLIELLVVIAIIGILSSVVLASLNDARQKSRDAKRISDVKQLQLALELNYDATGNYPTALTALTTAGYIASIPTDPSDNTINYSYAALGNLTTCSSYHLGSGLESSTHKALSADQDAAAGTVCTNGGTDFNGADVAGTNCSGTANSGRTCYDVKP